jgi:uncharacterized membrane protein SpoIIM required for sporulation
MILDLDKFLAAERPHWDALEEYLVRFESGSGGQLTLDELRRFHYLYERTSSDLGKLTTFASEPDTRRYLETLVARAYAEIHETRSRATRFRPLHWFFTVFPETFRRHLNAFWISLATTTAGVLFGVLATAIDPDSRHVTMAFGHDRMTPTERVQREMANGGSVNGASVSFSTQLMTHNTQVSILTLSLGMTFGIGTLVSLFYNGVILGAISLDYIQDGQAHFLAGWILPHGSIELPAILIAGQGGLILGAALLGRGAAVSLRMRLRAVTPDLVTLIGGVAVMLVWAGLVEGLLSQYHEPILPYSVKIAFGLFELSALVLFLGLSGRASAPNPVHSKASS